MKTKLTTKSQTKINRKQLTTNKSKKLKKLKKQVLTLESPIIKKIQKKHKHDKLYKIIWNGGRPLTTYISKDNNIYVYTMNYDKYNIKGTNTTNNDSYNSNNTYEFLFEPSGYKYHTENVFNLNKSKVNKIFIADSLLLDHTLKNNNDSLVHKFYSRYFKESLSYDTDNNNWQGNAILINTNNKASDKLEYVAILGSPGIIKFKLDKGEEITEFYSLIGPSATPYAVAYSENYLYVFEYECVVKIKLSTTDKNLSLGSKINGYTDIYSYYREKKNKNKRISNIHFKLLYKPVI